ncbi:hypothetical protein ES879_22095 [Salmonella enterica]|nr:hypothetical protein [Salmonella enterica]
MAKADDYLPSQTEVDHILYCKKNVSFTGAQWKQKPNRAGMWLQMHLLPTDEDFMPVQGLTIELRWKPDQDSKADASVSYPKINIVALYNKKRVFAVDTYPFDKHTNSFYIAHPNFQKSILGPHYHVYYEEAGYYSERIAFPIMNGISPDDLVGYWKFFCQQLNITFSGSLPIPLEDESGQMGFGI